MAAVADTRAMVKAIAAVSKGASGGFLQTRTACALKLLVAGPKVDVPDYSRRQVLSFLSGNPLSPGCSGQSGDIVGVPRQRGARWQLRGLKPPASW